MDVQANDKETKSLLNIKTVRLKRKEDIDISDPINETDNIKDSEIRVIDLGGGIKMRLVDTKNGYVVDIRKYYIDHFTQRGVRISARKFVQGSRLIQDDIEEALGKID